MMIAYKGEKAGNGNCIHKYSVTDKETTLGFEVIIELYLSLPCSLKLIFFARALLHSS